MGNFDISHAFLPLTVAKLSTLKNSPVFWRTVYVRRTAVYGTGRYDGGLDVADAELRVEVLGDRRTRRAVAVTYSTLVLARRRLNHPVTAHHLHRTTSVLDWSGPFQSH